MIVILDQEVFILSAARTPIGRFQGALSPFSAVELGGKAIEGALRHAAVSPERVEMVTMGCVISAGLGEAPAKQAALLAGIPGTVYSRTVENVCGSSMEAIIATVDALLVGRIELGVAGGMESRTNAPYLLEPRFFKSGPNYARGERPHLKRTGAFRWQFSENSEEQANLAGLVDATAHDGLFWPPEKKFMREYAVAYAAHHRISVERVNTLASLSHQKARQAQAGGDFDAEIVPLGDVVRDELPIEEELIAARNAEPLDIASSFNTSIPADNASALILSGSAFAGGHRRKPIARILGWSRVDRPAAEFLDSPVEAVRSLLEALARAGYAESKFEIFEINEAFGIQLPVFAESFPGKKINMSGGAVALGHPLGSAGARLLVTLVHSLKRLKASSGIVSLCYGGGGAYALAVESTAHSLSEP